jgi:TatD DNase family protein
MEIVDTHCHIHEVTVSSLNDATHDKWAKAGKSGAAAADAIIADAHAAGVTRLICVGTDVDDSTLAAEFVQSRPGTWASIGIHPHEAKRYSDDAKALQRFEALTLQPKVVAVGECGLDYFYNHSPQADQEKLLRLQIEMALRHDLPMIFHVREAFGDFWPIFDDYHQKSQGGRGTQKIRGVIHSFSATQRELDAILERDLFVGLNGIVTFAKANKDIAQIEAFQSVPATKMLIETDAPYLTPSPYRGTICESKHATTTLSFVAGIQGKKLKSGQSVEESTRLLAAQTTENARHLFDLS